MNKLKAIVIIMACFMIGMSMGMRQEPTNLIANTIQKEIVIYETQLNESESLFIPLSEREDLVDVTPLQHNNISRLGHEIGQWIKVGVRELLRYCIILIDQLISQ